MQNSEMSKCYPTVKGPINMHIVVLMGGLSAEKEVSLISGKAIADNLIEMGYSVTSIDMGRDIAKIIWELSPDLVFNALHGTYGEDGCVSGMLEIMGIAYTHSGVFASAVAMDKIHSQNLFVMNNILCPKRVIIEKNTNFPADPMPRPYIIKPIAEGSSFGVEVVFEGDDFSALDYKFEYGNKAIVEEFIKGKEINVAIIGQKAIGTLEIEILKSRFYDFETKYIEGNAIHHCPARISEKNEKKVLDIASKAAKIIDCRGVARAEFRYSEEQDEFYFLEINTHPGFTPLSIVPEIASYYNINFKEVLKLLIEDALDHYVKKRTN